MLAYSPSPLPFLNACLSLVAKIWIRPDFAFFFFSLENNRIIYPGWKASPHGLVHALSQYLYCSNGHLSHPRQWPTQDRVPLQEGMHPSWQGKQWAGRRAPSQWDADKIQVFLLPSHCFLLWKKGWQPIAYTLNRVCGQLQSAQKDCSSHWFLKLEQFGKSFFPCSVGFCQRYLLWCPAEHPI